MADEKNFYGFDETTKSEGSTGGLTGILDNFELPLAGGENAKKDGTSAITVLAFNFERGNFKFRHTEMPVNPEFVKKNAVDYPATANLDIKDPSYGLDLKKGDSITPDDAVKLAYRDLNIRVKHILTKFMSDADAVIKAKDWKDYCDQISAKVKANTKDKKVRLKIVYNKAGFLSFPKFVPFIESMDVKETKLTINPKYDKLSKETPDTNTTKKATTEEEF
jgi:hypothetical protein